MTTEGAPPVPDRTLVLLRHGKSDWSGGEPDPGRPLAPRGRRQVPRTGRWLSEHVPALDLAVVSPATRARETWELVAAELEAAYTRPPTRVDDRVYAASGPDLLEVVHELGDDTRTVVLVGHNPGLEELAEALTGEAVRLPTSAVAVLTVAGPWSAVVPGTVVLRASGRPPEG
jgi:phosphohistidine phosphatase